MTIFKQGNKKTIFLLISIFAIFLFFRLYNIDKRIIFNWDQERDAWIIKQILQEKKLTLIGPRVLGPEGFFLAPYFVYLLAPFYSLTNLHPQAMIYFIAFYNFSFFTASFLILKKLFSKKLALIFLFLWAIHPASITMDTISWNPLFIPIMVVLVFWLLFESLKKDFIKQWFFIGAAFGLGINFHFQFAFLFPFILTFLFWKSKKKLKKIIFFFLGAGVCFLPLLVFDLRHQGLNSKLLLDFIVENGDKVNFISWFPVWENVVSGFLGFNFFGLPFLFYLLVAFVVGFFARAEKEFWLKKFFLGFFALWLFFPIGFFLFGERPSEYYFNFLYPFLIFLLSFLMLKVFKKWQFVFIIIPLIFLLRAAEIKSFLKTNPLSLYYKDEVARRILEVGKGKDFNVSFSVPLGMDTGYRYLFSYHKIKQSGDFDDVLLQIVIPPNDDCEKFGRIGLLNSFQLPVNTVK